MEAEEFNYYFEHGEFMPISAKKIREARNDDTIERPARHISMTSGDEEQPEAGQNASDGITDAPVDGADTPDASGAAKDETKGE